ncbi:phage tail assembly protein [Thalassospira indica]|uniref:Phage tail assembly protein n=1 Tax=Thalassospira indica TaxID=1891279 RepID=A0ABN5NIJ4_9PROT|nr:phage tail assembly protein [Thalassospira indica]AXO13763.1 phage tail assembly protein [Thalassospira indica]
MTKKTDDIAAATNGAVNASFDHTFVKPLPYGSEKTLDKTTIRRPLGGDLRGVKLIQLSELDANVLFGLLPRITSPALTEAHVQMMDPRDSVAIMQGLAENFFTA